MRATRHSIGIALLVAAFAIIAPDRSTRSTVTACGPITLFPVFTPLDAPDQDDFVSGNLGILQPTYERRYLLAAWRILNGRPLTGEEQAVFNAGRMGAHALSASETWRTVRATVSEIAAPNVTQDAFLPTYSYIVNCSDSALVTAARTLEARRTSLGAGSQQFLDWVRAQDLVFSNCDRRLAAAPAIPATLGPDAPAAIRADRDYQVAAAYFYAGDFDDAETRFLAIASDTASPWQPWGRYLAARAAIRRGTMGGADGAGDPKSLERAEAQLRAVLADRTLPATHAPADQLLEFLSVRREPMKTLAAAGIGLESPAATDTFRKHLDTYEYLMKRFPPGSESPSDLIDWVLAMQVSDTDDEHAARSVTRWQKSQSPAWLVAALAHATPPTAHLDDLLAAAASIDRQSPAYPTTAFHRARLLILSGRAADARTALSEAIDTPHLPRATLNAMRMARLATARTFDEFLADAVRVPVDQAYGNGGMPAGAPALDQDAALVLNERLPLELLRRAAFAPSLPKPLQRDLLLATFTRALLLQRTSTVRSLVANVSQDVPAVASALKPLAASANDAVLRDEGAVLLARYPGLRPFYTTGRSRAADLGTLDTLRDNWWCSFAAESSTPYETQYWRGSLDEPAKAIYPGITSMPWPAFLTADERRAAADEWQQLKTLDTAPNEIGRRVLDWARRHPRDPRVPEALHRVVRATRYGCTNDATGPVSKAAFTLLHRQYPQSPWTAKTPLWFK